jgi:hypothetical protein
MWDIMGYPKMSNFTGKIWENGDELDEPVDGMGYHIYLDETVLIGSFPAGCFVELRLQLRTSGDKPMIQSQPCQAFEILP